MASTRLFINDVGEDTWEEIDEGMAGANYGWPIREGPCVTGSSTNCGPPPPGMTNPIHWYGHNVTINGSGCDAITGAAFVPNGYWPNSFDNGYFYADYVCGQLWELTPDGQGGYIQTEFATVESGVVSMRCDLSGSTHSLYYTTQASAGQVRRITFTGSFQCCCRDIRIF